MTEKKPLVSYKDKKLVELPVAESFDKKFSPQLIVQQKPRQLDETYMKDFIGSRSKRVQQLIFSIVSDDSIGPDIRRILTQDDTFRQILHDAKNQFDQGYNLFE